MTGGTILRCESCGATYGDDFANATCSACDGLLLAEHAPPAARGSALRSLFDSRVVPSAASARERSGVWRFRELVLHAADNEIISHPEGNTPLIIRPTISAYAGVDDLVIKHEGHNPTGSFKDRGMTVALTQARRVNARAVACASTGNTSASLSAYAAQAGIPAFVFVPAGQISAGKLAQTIAYGARVLPIDGDFDECLRLAREASTMGIYLVNSVNPFRLEGQKTIVFELLQQLGWQSPDWIALPAGNLGNTSAFGKALREARSFGMIDRVPRLLAVQAAGAAPFAKAFAEGFVTRHRVRAETRATAIRIGDPASWDRAVTAITETDGRVVAVTDEEIFAAKAEIDHAGVGCEPASAASIAGVRKLVASGEIASSARVAAVLTGHLLKDPGGQADSSIPAPLSYGQAIGVLRRLIDS
jgi:threonine synthase